MKKKLALLAASLAMLLTVTAALALAQTEPVDEDQLRCLIPEGCDTNGDGMPDLRAGEPAPGPSPGAVQYDNAA